MHPVDQLGRQVHVEARGADRQEGVREHTRERLYRQPAGCPLRGDCVRSAREDLHWGERAEAVRDVRYAGQRGGERRGALVGVVQHEVGATHGDRGEETVEGVVDADLAEQPGCEPRLDLIWRQSRAGRAVGAAAEFGEPGVELVPDRDGGEAGRGRAASEAARGGEGDVVPAVPQRGRQREQRVDVARLRNHADEHPHCRLFAALLTRPAGWVAAGNSVSVSTVVHQARHWSGGQPRSTTSRRYCSSLTMA